MSTRKTNNPGPVPGLLLALSLMLASVQSEDVTAAPAPVEELRPVTAVVNKVSDEPVVMSSSADPGEKDFNQTAHLLNMIEQLRQEMMDIRGQLETHTFRIEQLQQENRDRYLDLDERVSRLNGQAGKVGETTSSVTSLKTPLATVPVDGTAKDQAVLDAEEAAYKSAFNFIRSKQFDQAKTALQELLKTYPDGRYADNARYWLGEVNMAQGRYDDARESFQIVLSDFPKSPKVPDASYKLGRVYDLLGNQQKARNLLESVIKQYPDSTAARLSDSYLRTAQ